MADEQIGSPAPSIGVVVPAHDAADTLDATLASIAAQRHPATRVVVVDDCSGDDTAGVASRWVGRLPLEVIRLEENQGPAAARRAAIGTLDTELLALLDADDLWLPDHLEAMVGAYEDDRSLVCAHELRWIPGTGLSLPSQRTIPRADDQLRSLLLQNYVLISALFSRECYQQVGGFRDGLTGAEDWDLWIRLLRSGGVVRATSHATVVYRLSKTSVSADDRSLDSDLRVLELAVTEANDVTERRWARAGLRRLRARRHLVDAYAAARLGRGSTARATAVRALAGSPAVARRAAVMVVAPGWGVRARDARKWGESRWLVR